MSIFNYILKGYKYVTNKYYRFIINANLGLYNNMPDDVFLKRYYKSVFGRELDLENPSGFNEKMQWLKLNNRKDLYTTLVDKYEVRDYVASVIGDEYLIPLLGVWENADDINFDELPDQFVLKCNHNSGTGMCICKDKSNLDIAEVRKGLQSGLHEDYYIKTREWPYKNVKRKVICEKYMTDDKNSESFTDYKFFCFDGYVDCVMICKDRNIGKTKFYFMDRQWNLCRYNVLGKSLPENFTIEKPINMDKMFEIAGILSRGLPFARIDLYNSNGKIYFGEITFFPDSGFDHNLLPETNERFGNLINIKKQG